MSEREVIENAKRKGRRAYWQGIPLEANPMRSLFSKHAWAEAWKKERDEMEGRRLAREKYGPMSTGNKRTASGTTGPELGEG